jgi:hypothetical protein
MSDCKYIKGGARKYVLAAPYNDKLKFKPKRTIVTKYAKLYSDGRLVINTFYEWDGPSGPAIDTDNFMDGSLVHDLLYQFMREGYLKPIWWYRLKADNEMFRQCKKDKMLLPRRMYTWLGVRLGGIFAARRW